MLWAGLQVIPADSGAPAVPAAAQRAWRGRIVTALLAMAAGTVLTLLFLAYLRPGFLIDLLNLRYCG